MLPQCLLSPELLGHFWKLLKLLGGPNEFDEWTIKFYVVPLLWLYECT